MKYGLFLPECTTPEIPVAAFNDATGARDYGETHYSGRYVVKPLASVFIPEQSECVTGIDAYDNINPPLLNTSGRCDRGEHKTCTRSSCECPCHVSRCSSCRKEVRSLCKGCGHDPRPRVSVAICLVSRARGRNGVLMVKHRERGWEFPVGKVEPEELLDVAASRELREETGVEVSPHFFKFVGLFQLTGRGFGHWLNFMFVVDYDSSDAKVAHEVVDEALDGLQWISWDILDRALCAQNHDASALIEGVPGFAVSKTAHMIVNNARRSRDLRDPGYATHCARCLGMIPCNCMRGI